VSPITVLESVSPCNRERPPLLCLAAVNGPDAVVLSGDADAVEEIAGLWAALGRRTKRLRTSHAFHSHHLDGTFAEFGAIAAAEHLESLDAAPAAVILLDVYPPDERELLERLIPAVIRGLQDRSERMLGGEDDAWLTAMGRYMSFDWTPSAVSAPTLLVRSSRPLPGLPEDASRQATWKFPHTAVDVPGDHFTMVEAHAGASAESVDEWLRTRATH
jgi:thioesterase domain-containing protein